MQLNRWRLIRIDQSIGLLIWIKQSTGILQYLQQCPAQEIRLSQEADTKQQEAPNWTIEPPSTAAKLPAIVPDRSSHRLPVPMSRPHRRGWVRVALGLAIILVGAAGGAYWWNQHQAQLPAGVFWGNGRLEADEIDIDTKYAGRIAQVLADEGDMVRAGQVVARMDTRDLEASLKKSEAQVRQAQKAIDEAKANVAQQTSLMLLAKQQMDRAVYLVQKGAQTKEVLDQRQQVLDGADAALKAAEARVIEAEHALQAATHDVELYSVQIADNTLVAPTDGRIQYRLARVGEVLPAGGKVFAMLDISYVYMDVYLPTEAAGKARFGADSRIVLDAYPQIAIPAKVSFIATQAQFTPKTVETKTERDKLMFRIRVRIDPERLRARGDAVRSGLPGIAYVRTDPAVDWPAWLQRITPQ
jgi:HlyD family secretion protein